MLAGSHPRPPVVSLQATGQAKEAIASLSTFLPAALETAHINPRSPIQVWFGQQLTKSTATTTAGDWNVEFSTEVDSEKPGATLTLTDKLCKVGCGAE